MNNETVTSLWAEKNVTGNSTSSYKGLITDSSSIAPQLVELKSTLHAICRGGQSGNVIDLLARRCLPLSHPSLASDACAVVQISSSKLVRGTQTNTLLGWAMLRRDNGHRIQRATLGGTHLACLEMGYRDVRPLRSHFHALSAVPTPVSAYMFQFFTTLFSTKITNFTKFPLIEPRFMQNLCSKASNLAKIQFFKPFFQKISFKPLFLVPTRSLSPHLRPFGLHVHLYSIPKWKLNSPRRGELPGA